MSDYLCEDGIHEADGGCCGVRDAEIAVLNAHGWQDLLDEVIDARRIIARVTDLAEAAERYGEDARIWPSDLRAALTEGFVVPTVARPWCPRCNSSPQPGTPDGGCSAIVPGEKCPMWSDA